MAGPLSCSSATSSPAPPSSSVQRHHLTGVTITINIIITSIVILSSIITHTNP